MSNEIAVMNVRGGEVMQMTDAQQVVMIWRQAEALARLFSYSEESAPERQAIVEARNSAMRRVGQMYLSIDHPPRNKLSDTDNLLTKQQFRDNLGFSRRDVMKITSVANLTDEQWAERKALSGDDFWKGTVHGLRLESDRQRIKDALKAKKREKQAENQEKRDEASINRHGVPEQEYIDTTKAKNKAERDAKKEAFPEMFEGVVRFTTGFADKIVEPVDAINGYDIGTLGDETLTPEQWAIIRMDMVEARAQLTEIINKIEEM